MLFGGQSSLTQDKFFGSHTPFLHPQPFTVAVPSVFGKEEHIIQLSFDFKKP